MFLACVAAAAIACCPVQAGATTYATLTATFVDNIPSQAGYTSTDSGMTYRGAWEVGPSVFTANSLTIAASGVPFALSEFLASLVPTNANPNPQFKGWCVDISREIWQNTQHAWAIGDLADVPAGYQMGGVKAADLERLFTLMPQGDGVTADRAAAFQAAVWEVVNETSKKANGAYDYNVKAGSFRVSGGSTWVNLANGLLTEAANKTTSSVYAMYSTDTQSFAFFVPTFGGGSTTPVPEPITFVTGLMVVSGLGYYVRRTTRAASAKA
jgi:hypothetical protein